MIETFIGYMFLGAWLSALIVASFFLIFTGNPSDDNADGSIGLKTLYVISVMVTFYAMGTHFGGL